MTSESAFWPELLASARKLRGLSQRAAAREIGTSARSLCRWEGGVVPLPVFRRAILRTVRVWVEEALEELGQAEQ